MDSFEIMQRVVSYAMSAAAVSLNEIGVSVHLLEVKNFTLEGGATGLLLTSQGEFEIVVRKPNPQQKSREPEEEGEDRE